jgi:hypothetical protein
MHGYPLLDIFWTTLEFFIWILWIFLLARIFMDVFRSPDLTGWARAGWTVVLVLVPLIGVLVYLVVRGSQMHLREAQQAHANADTFQRLGGSYGMSSSPADELSKLAQLRDQGVLSEGEFNTLKARLLVSSS